MRWNQFSNKCVDQKRMCLKFTPFAVDSCNSHCDTINMKMPRQNLAINLHANGYSTPVDWIIEHGLVDYDHAVAAMEERVAAISNGTANECVWLVEHPAIYTAGTSANFSDLLSANRLPVYKTGRGGEFTYHGPGQRVAYVMLDLKRRKPDVRAFVAALEQWVIETIGAFNIRAERREDRVGVWVKRPEKPALADGSCCEDKIAAIGIRLRRWVSFHGISINVEPELDDYQGIVPCGITGHGITSLVDLGLPATMDDLDMVLKQKFTARFGRTQVKREIAEKSNLV